MCDLEGSYTPNSIIVSDWCTPTYYAIGCLPCALTRQFKEKRMEHEEEQQRYRQHVVARGRGGETAQGQVHARGEVMLFDEKGKRKGGMTHAVTCIKQSDL
jgi:hypothetical protein